MSQSHYFSWCGMFFKRLVFLFLQCQHIVEAELGNIALHKPATQISTYEESGHMWSAGHAVDGNSNCTDPPESQYYSGTKSNGYAGSWWRVDLQYSYDINRVVVRGPPNDTADLLTGFRLYLTDDPVDRPDVSTSVYNNTDYGSGIFDIPVTKTARYCMLHRPNAYKPIVLCEVEVYGSVVDLIAMIKPSVSTSMSSKGTYNTENRTNLWDSDNAVDNVIYGNPNNCSCCSGTSGNEHPWLQIDLGRDYRIGIIKIYGRTDKSSPEQYRTLNVFVSNNSMEAVGKNPMETVNGIHVYYGNPNDGNYTYTLPIEKPLSFRYLIIRRFITSVLTICEVQLIESRNLVDRLKYSAITSQSSDWVNFGYDSSKAIDRLENYDIDNCQCCSVTGISPSPSWWQINLRSRYLVDTLEVFGRQSRQNQQLEHAVIYASNLSLVHNFDSTTKIKVFEIPEIVNSTHFIHHLRYPVIAQFLMVTLDNQQLTLCEFNAYGTGPVCETGRFGDACTQRCHCFDKRPCHYLTGICRTLGCLPGWSGVSCDTGFSYIDAIHVGCDAYSWNITINLPLLRQIYSNLVSSDIYLGENKCTGVETNGNLVFQKGLDECVTNILIRGTGTVYVNELVYAEHDPVYTFIIRHINWTYPVECDHSRNSSTSGTIQNNDTNQLFPKEQYPVNVSTYLDSSFLKEVPNNPVRADIGSKVYVKVFSTTSDWNTYMRLRTCYTKPTPGASDNQKYFLIKNGLEILYSFKRHFS